MLNYMGQGAMILSMTPAEAQLAIRDPFFLMVPEIISTPVIILTIFAAIIASQAVISGAFSLTQQAIQLGFMPRLSIRHTSESAAGQIYIPSVNWALAIMVLLLVLFFQSSSNLAAAYGIAVTGAMFIDTCLISVVLLSLWKWPKWKALPVLAVFFVVDFAYFGSNLLKVPSGGWVPLAIGLVIFTLLTTWARGRALMRERMAESTMPMDIFIKSAAGSAQRVPGTAIFMASTSAGVPSALLHNIKHNRVLHERVIILTVQIAEVPYVDEAKRATCKALNEGFHRVILRFGFLEETDVPAALANVNLCGAPFEMMQTSFFLSRQTLIASKAPGMAIWREKIFAWMLRNAANAMEFFRLPSNRVVELGSQVEI
jgi:KUP system potassium uptake protein